MGVLGVCLSLAAAGALVQPVFIATERFTLAWTHSIEKVRWEEDYAIVLPPGYSQPILQALTARVRGSAAGMEPPDGAVLRQGWYEYPAVNTSPQGLRLTRSEYTADYVWCQSGHCQPLGRWLPSDGDITLLKACSGPR